MSSEIMECEWCHKEVSLDEAYCSESGSFYHPECYEDAGDYYANKAEDEAVDRELDRRWEEENEG